MHFSKDDVYDTCLFHFHLRLFLWVKLPPNTGPAKGFATSTQKAIAWTIVDKVRHLVSF